MLTTLESSFICSLASYLPKKLRSLAENEIESIIEVDSNLRLLKAGAQSVQAKLDGVQSSELETHANWKAWVREATEFFYDMDDLIEDFRQAETRQPILPLKFWQLAPKVTILLNKLRDVERDMMSLMNSGHGERRDNHNPNTIHESLTLANALPLTSGRQADKENIIKKLMVRSAHAHGVSIVGMAGLGKTTLAQSIVDDLRVRKYFYSIKWVSASGGLNNTKSIEVQRPRLISSASIKKRLFPHDSIKTLCVLDGFDEYQPDSMASHVQRGDTLLITSRDPRVAASTLTAAYYLKRMSDEECNDLIKAEMYDGLSYNDQRFFDTRASNIAKKCMGLPLVASILGIKLHHDCASGDGGAIEAIIRFEQTDLWTLIGQEILRALRLDHKKLAPHLNKLAYFTLFPHDHLFSEDCLAQLWMAEGFIQYEEWTNRIPGQRQFDDMLPMSMVLPGSDESPDERPSAYQTNVITHGFAQSIACNMCMLMDTDDYPSLADIAAPRHLSLCCQSVPISLLKDIVQHFKRLRTFLLLHQNGTNISRVPSSLFQLSRLRVLDLSRSSMTSVPVTICNLKHLRYLDLSCTQIKALPDSICNLVRLVILKLQECLHLKQLPKGIGKLVNLVYLELNGTNLRCTPRRVGKLKKLQTLCTFSVEEEEGYRISELKNLNALRGSIKIMQLENVKNGDAVEAELQMKPDLRSITLEWTESMMLRQTAAEDILSQLQPHKNLSELRVCNYGGVEFPSWISSLSCHLRIIHLYNCPEITQLPPLWVLPFLKTLHIESFCELQYLDRQFLGDVECVHRFISLEQLEIRNMQKLTRFEGLTRGDMPYLRELKFVRCPALTLLPPVEPLASLTYLEIESCWKLGRDRGLPASLRLYLFNGQCVLKHSQ